MRVANSDREIEQGAELLSVRLGQAARQPMGGSPVIGFFASARGKKNLGMQWWRDFWQEYLEVRPDTAPLEVLPKASHPPVNGEFATVHCPSPRMLAATISHVSGFFSADTGPMHLASAAGVPTIAFFNWTHPRTFGPIGPNRALLPDAEQAGVRGDFIRQGHRLDQSGHGRRHTRGRHPTKRADAGVGVPGIGDGVHHQSQWRSRDLVAEDWPAGSPAGDSTRFPAGQDTRVHGSRTLSLVRVSSTGGWSWEGSVACGCRPWPVVHRSGS